MMSSISRSAVFPPNRPHLAAAFINSRVNLNTPSAAASSDAARHSSRARASSASLGTRSALIVLGRARLSRSRSPHGRTGPEWRPRRDPPTTAPRPGGCPNLPQAEIAGRCTGRLLLNEAAVDKLQACARLRRLLAVVGAVICAAAAFAAVRPRSSPAGSSAPRPRRASSRSWMRPGNARCDWAVICAAAALAAVLATATGSERRHRSGPSRWGRENVTLGALGVDDFSFF